MDISEIAQNAEKQWGMINTRYKIQRKGMVEVLLFNPSYSAWRPIN